MYQNIVDNFPKCEWAMMRSINSINIIFYSLYKTADQKLTQLKENIHFLRMQQKKIRQREKQAAKEKPTVMKPKGSVPKYATNFTVQVGAFSTLKTQ